MSSVKSMSANLTGAKVAFANVVRLNTDRIADPAAAGAMGIASLEKDGVVHKTYALVASLDGLIE